MELALQPYYLNPQVYATATIIGHHSVVEVSSRKLDAYAVAFSAIGSAATILLSATGHDKLAAAIGLATTIGSGVLAFTRIASEE